MASRKTLKLAANTVYQMIVKYVDWSVHDKYGAGVKLVLVDGNGEEWSKIFSEWFAKDLHAARVAQELDSLDSNGCLNWKVWGEPLVKIVKVDDGSGKSKIELTRLNAVPGDAPADFGKPKGPKPAGAAPAATAAAPAPAAGPAPAGVPAAPVAGGPPPASAPTGPGDPVRELAKEGALMAACLNVAWWSWERLPEEAPDPSPDVIQAMAVSLFIQAKKGRIEGVPGMDRKVLKLLERVAGTGTGDSGKGAPAPAPVAPPPPQATEPEEEGSDEDDDLPF